MKSILFILFQIVAIMQQINAENHLWKLLAKPPAVFIPNLCNSLNADWKVLGDPRDCRKFFGCVNNVTEHLECAENYYFNNIAMHCMPGNCHHSTNDECEAHEVLPVANECRKFTFCKKGKRELYHCPLTQFFDSEMSVCRPHQNSPDAKCRCGDIDNNNIFANKENCATYYTCVNGKAVLVQCPKGEYFNTTTNSCLRDVSAICLAEPTMSPPVIPPQIYDLCVANDVNGVNFFSSPIDCKTFFICVQGQLLIQQCPEGFYFDDEELYCRADKKHVCKKRHTHEKENEQNGDKKHQHHHISEKLNAGSSSEKMHGEVANFEGPKRRPVHSKYDTLSSKFLKFFNL